jgi:hypothetical protein
MDMDNTREQLQALIESTDKRYLVKYRITFEYDFQATLDRLQLVLDDCVCYKPTNIDAFVMTDKVTPVLGMEYFVLNCDNLSTEDLLDLAMTYDSYIREQ